MLASPSGLPKSSTTCVFEARQKVFALLHGTYLQAVVSEVAVDCTTGEPLYYVHYVDQDNRLDRWLPGKDIRERHQGRGCVYKPTPVRSGGGVSTRRQAQVGRADDAAAPSSPSSSHSDPHGNAFLPCSPVSSAGQGGSPLFPTEAPSMGVSYGGGGFYSPVVASKGSAGTPTQKMSTMRARKDSSFFSRSKNIQSICMGPHEVETWYFSPYHLARPAVHQRLEMVAGQLPSFAEKMEGDAEVPVNPTAQDSTLGVVDLTGDDVFSSGGGLGSSGLQPSRGTPLKGKGSDRPPPSLITQSFTLHICPFCLHPFFDHSGVIGHLKTSCLRHPPGNEVYRDPVRQLIVIEVDGKLEPTFCEHLALLSKLFLEHKALDHDMSPFLFYVLCSIQPLGLQVLGYFSKEKTNPDEYNLSCILVLPQFQSRGVGRFLIEMSYELSRREGKVGTPEKPLSDLGEKLYLRYWSDALLVAIARAREEGHCVSVDYLVQATSIVQADVFRALQYLGVLDAPDSVSKEMIERCFTKRLQREGDIQNFTFYSHLLNWAPTLYQEVQADLPPMEYEIV